jgi:putative DNA primase/helicase
MSGILNWAVEGCIKWQKEGLGYPKEVKEATESYREEMDSVGDFLKEHCAVDVNAKSYCNDLYKAFEFWCGESGELL